MCLKEGSFQSLHWLGSSLNHLAGPAGGFHGPLLPSTMVASFHSQRRPGGTHWECLPKRQVGRSLLSGGVQTTAIRVLRRQDCKVCQVSFYVNRTTASQQVIIRRGDGASWGWVTMLVIHLHDMGLAFGWRGIRGLHHGTH